MPEDVIVSEIRQVLDRIGSGELEVEEAVPLVRAAVRSGEPDDLGDGDTTLRRLAGTEDDRDGRGTWTEVEAARVTGRLTQEQCAALRAGVLGGAW